MNEQLWPQKLSSTMKSLPQDVSDSFKDIYAVDFLNLPEGIKKGIYKSFSK
jgi:hypothetical protein